ncbi:NAD-dependent epimerase/dehydratase family protein [Chloroflexota bacterium]
MIFVTGRTGFVGSHLAPPRLVKTGYKIRCLVRSLVKAEALQRHDAEFVLGSVNGLPALEQAMQDVKTVIHLVAIIGESNAATFDRINFWGTRNVVQAADVSGVK